MMNTRAYLACTAISVGRRSVSSSDTDQMIQMTAAPRMAPRLLPEPPRMSMIQIRKVAIIGSIASGVTERLKCTNSAPASPISAEPNTKACSRRASTCLPIAAAASSLSRIARIMRPQGAFTWRSTSR